LANNKYYYKQTENVGMPNETISLSILSGEIDHPDMTLISEEEYNGLIESKKEKE